MKIQRIKIDGYRSLKNIDINDLNDVNIFYGDNNTGKSNIIDAIDIFFSEKKETVPTKEGIITNIKFEGPIDIKRSDFFKNRDEPIYYEVHILLEKDDVQELKERINDEKMKKLLKGLECELIIKAEIASELTNKRKGDLKITSLIFDGKETASSGSDATYRPLAEPIKLFLMDRFRKIDASRQIMRETDEQNKEEGVSGKNIQKYLFELCHSSEESKHVLFRRINKSFNELFDKIGDIEFSFESDEHPHKKVITDEKGTDVVVEKDVKEIKIRVFSSDKNLLLPIENIGSGLKQSLIILSNIIANSWSKIFGIEELELNLSPEGQKTVFAKLLEMKDKTEIDLDQLFLTSHSPVFKIMEKKGCQVYWVEMDMDKSVTIVKKITQSQFIKHIYAAIPPYTLCPHDCKNDNDSRFFDKIAKELGIDIKEAEKIFEEEICPQCNDEEILNKSPKDLKDFKEKKLDELIAKRKKK